MPTELAGRHDGPIALVERLIGISKRTGIPHDADFSGKPSGSYLPGMLDSLRIQEASGR